MDWPCRTESPGETEPVTGSKLLSSPPPWSMVTTPRSTTRPVNRTVPAAGLRTASPGAAARSTPRCPGSQRCSGLSNPRRTPGSGESGHCQVACTARAGPASTGPAALHTAAPPRNRIKRASTAVGDRRDRCRTQPPTRSRVQGWSGAEGRDGAEGEFIHPVQPGRGMRGTRAAVLWTVLPAARRLLVLWRR